MTVYQFSEDSMAEPMEPDGKAVSISLARSSKFSRSKEF